MNELRGKLTTKRLFIWGTTFPEWSEKYFETVCTGAIDGGTGRLLRIYPIRFPTLMEDGNRFHKYQWIEAPIEKNQRDFRPESFRVDQERIVIGERIGTEDGWRERERLILNPQNLFPSVETLWDAQRRDHTSLGLVKPAKVVDVYQARRPQADRSAFDEHRLRARQNLFENDIDPEGLRDLAYVPVEYRVKFQCDDARCKTHDMSIRDWEVYQLSRASYARREGDAQATDDVLNKLWDCFDLKKRDTRLFLGNMMQHPESFMIVGIFWPPIEKPKERSKAVIRGLFEPC